MSGSTGSGVVAFDSVYFYARFPEFSTVSATLLGYYFGEAGILLNNTPTSVVQDSSVGGRRYLLLHLLTAHIASLYSGVNGIAPSGLVGRISDASEGSVRVAVDMGTQPAAAAYFLQTNYGTEFWWMTADLRTGTFVGGGGRRRFVGYVS
jgi:hypothetical protein